VPPDFLKGHLKIVWLGAAEASNEMPRSEVAPESYAAYPPVILSQEGKESRGIARFTADENGNYHPALPPGDYVLDVQQHAPGHVRAKPQRFTAPFLPNHSKRARAQQQWLKLLTPC
jgi:hypothetical protein